MTSSWPKAPSNPPRRLRAGARLILLAALLAGCAGRQWQYYAVATRDFCHFYEPLTPVEARGLPFAARVDRGAGPLFDRAEILVNGRVREVVDIRPRGGIPATARFRGREGWIDGDARIDWRDGGLSALTLDLPRADDVIRLPGVERRTLRFTDSPDALDVAEEVVLDDGTVRTLRGTRYERGRVAAVSRFFREDGTLADIEEFDHVARTIRRRLYAPGGPPPLLKKETRTFHDPAAPLMTPACRVRMESTDYRPDGSMVKTSTVIFRADGREETTVAYDGAGNPGRPVITFVRYPGTGD